MSRPLNAQKEREYQFAATLDKMARRELKASAAGSARYATPERSPMIRRFLCAWPHRDHQGRIWAPAGRRWAGGGGVDEPGAVRWLKCSRGSQNNKIGACSMGKRPVSWARSEGLEPPNF
jgi:hypothetical protein